MVYTRKQHEVGGYMVVVLSAKKRKPSKVWRVQNRRLGGEFPQELPFCAKSQRQVGITQVKGWRGKYTEKRKWWMWENR